MSTFNVDAQPRTAWGGSAASPASYAPNASGIVVHWNGPPMGEYSAEQVPALIQATWRYHVERNGWADIAYNYSVDRFGRVWTGRGWQKWNAASGETSANQNLLAVECLIGEGDKLTQAMVDGLKRVVLAYVEGGNTPSVLGHRNVVATTCPGDELLGYVAQLDAMAKHPAGQTPTQPTNPGVSELPEYLIQATDKTVYAVYSDGRCRQLIYPELQYFQTVRPNLTMIATTNKENDQLIFDRSRLS